LAATQNSQAVNTVSANGTHLINTSGTTTSINGADVFTVLSGNYTHTIDGFAAGDKLNFFANAILNVVNDTNQTDGIQELTAKNSSTNETLTLKFNNLSNDADNGIFNIPSLTSVFGEKTLSFTGASSSGKDSYTITAGNDLSISGLKAGDKLIAFNGAILNIVNDTNQTDGIQVFTAKNSVTNTTATITLTVLTAAQDAGLFNIAEFDTVFGAGTIVFDNGATSGNDTFSISAGNSLAISHFGNGDKLSFFHNAILNLTNDTNQTDGIQELTATDPVTRSVATITLTGLTNDQDYGLFNIPSINTVFGAGTIVQL
jgi:hypothetical protein